MPAGNRISCRFADATRLVRELIEAPRFVEFLTLPAYDLITANLG
jgi:hypothetical protein